MDTSPAKGAIAITGATSGIGAALARHYAAPGVTLGLAGRNAERLAAVVQTCRDAGATVVDATFDIRDRDALIAFLRRIDDVAPLALVIANAGIARDRYRVNELDEHLEAVLETNARGVFDTVLAALDLMRPRGAGQIAIMSSLAGYLGFPAAPAYCASKAAVRVFGESLRGTCGKLGIRINVICPGFVATPMTDDHPEPMPFLVPPGKAAEIIARGLARDKGRIAFPWPMALGAWFLAALPYRAREWMLRFVRVWT